jgi:hypothetical protein
MRMTIIFTLAPVFMEVQSAHMAEVTVKDMKLGQVYGHPASQLLLVYVTPRIWFTVLGLYFVKISGSGTDVNQGESKASCDIL